MSPLDPVPPSIVDPADDPVATFLEAWAHARTTAPPDFDWSQVALATSAPGGMPSVRMVLLRGADPSGFTFFTNYGSRKARDLAANAQAALCFHWYWLERQVRVEGLVERTSDAESDAYFASRPRGSQLGAWASDQSEPLDSRERLDRRFREAEARFAGRDVPRPPFWGGFRVVPARIEFWQGASSRLHDRILYTREGSAWRWERLFP
ncbi:MAG: pyridoxamine 5'-phosphate oxidase [Vicinamibacteraceae bacterium]|nr:pyridoxamine 5'-phosphate oxidase [Vicinamibacteraceae bacterium]